MRFRKAAGLAGAAVLAIAGVIGASQFAAADPAPFRAAPAGLPKLVCGGENTITEGAASTSNSRVTASGRIKPNLTTEQAVTASLAGAPARVLDAMKSRAHATSFTGGKQIQAKDKAGNLIAVLNVVEHPENGSHVDSVKFCGTD